MTMPDPQEVARTTQHGDDVVERASDIIRTAIVRGETYGTIARKVLALSAPARNGEEEVTREIDSALREAHRRSTETVEILASNGRDAAIEECARVAEGTIAPPPADGALKNVATASGDIRARDIAELLRSLKHQPGNGPHTPPSGSVS